MAKQQDVIKKFMKTLDTTSSRGVDALTEAIQACSNFDSAESLIAKIVEDCRNAKSAESFLKEKCGIILDNSDTGAITGSDAGGSKVKTAESIVPESGALKNYTSNYFTKNGLTFTLNKNFSELSTKEKFIWQGMYTWWAESALNLIKSSYGYSFTDKNVSLKNVGVKFVEDYSTTWHAWNEWHTKSDGETDKVTIVINMRYYNDIVTTNPNGYSPSATLYLDKTLAHELTHTITYAKVLDGTALPSWFKEGLGELTIGIDNERKTDITYLAKNPSTLKKNLDGTSSAYNYESGYIFMRYLAKQGTTSPAARTRSITNSTANKTVMGTAYADTIKNYGANVTLSALGGNDSITNNGSKASIDGGAGNDTILNTGYGTNVTIYGGLGNDSLRNNAKAVLYGEEGADSFYNTSLGAYATIYGGSGKDTVTNFGDTVKIYAGSGDDSVYSYSYYATISGGTGNDTVSLNSSGHHNVITYDSGDGNDKIYNLGTTDTLSIGGGANVSLQTSGKNVIATVGKGKITLVGAASLSIINIQGSSGNDSIKSTVSGAKIDGGSGNDKIYNYASSKVTILGGSGADTINNWGGAASMVGGAGNDVIWGDSGNDTLSGGSNNDKLHGEVGNDKLYGGTGNDSLWGGAGNDSLWGGDGSDTFIYTANEGTDTIFDYSSGDMLKILKADGSKGSFSSYKYSGGDLTLTINGGGKVIFDNVSASTNFNINGTTYKISGNQFKKR